MKIPVSILSLTKLRASDKQNYCHKRVKKKMETDCFIESNQVTNYSFHIFRMRVPRFYIQIKLISQ